MSVTVYKPHWGVPNVRPAAVTDGRWVDLFVLGWADPQPVTTTTGTHSVRGSRIRTRLGRARTKFAFSATRVYTHAKPTRFSTETATSPANGESDQYIPGA